MDYFDPNQNWLPPGYDPYKGLSDDERMTAGCLQGASFIIMLAVTLLICALLGSCTTTRYVPVVETHNIYHHTTDTILKTDSVTDVQTVVIREVDSATMAQYGIRLQDVQRAWLIENSRLQREITEFRQAKTDGLVIHDSVSPSTLIVPAEKGSPDPFWHRFRLSVGKLLAVLLLVVLLLWAWCTK